MRTRALPLRALFAACSMVAAAAHAQAAEYAFSTYGLGGAAFGASVTPPPGIYVTTVSAFYTGDIGGSISFGGVVVNAGAKVEAYSSGLNVLYVPQRKLFGGNLGLAVTVPVGHVDLDANVSVGPLTAARGIDGWGFGDIVSRAQHGWQRGEFSHTAYVQAVAPTGRWEPGFSPIIGFHRPGIDTGWAFTWDNKATKLQFNGAAGFTFNFENTETDYRTGNEVSFRMGDWPRVCARVRARRRRLRLSPADGRLGHRSQARPPERSRRRDRPRAQLHHRVRHDAGHLQPAPLPGVQCRETVGGQFHHRLGTIRF